MYLDYNVNCTFEDGDYKCGYEVPLLNDIFKFIRHNGVTFSNEVRDKSGPTIDHTYGNSSGGVHFFTRLRKIAFFVIY